MSAKYQRVKRTDLALPAPLRWLTRAFSSITLAVVLLSVVALYGVLGTVPLGMLVLIGTDLAVVAGVVILPTWVAWRVLRLLLASPSSGRGAGGEGSALPTDDGKTKSPHPNPLPEKGEGAGTPAVLIAAFVALMGGVGAAFLCLYLHDLIGSTVWYTRWRGVHVYRLPVLEMTEGQFYSWWPFRVTLALFVVNMIWATIRRIEFNLLNLGVLTVHAGIVLIALGAVVYHAFKVEGDTIVFRADVNPEAASTSVFYDRDRPAIYIQRRGGPELMLPLDDLPRWNDYLPGTAGELDLALDPRAGFAEAVSRELEMSIVGFIAHGELTQEWRSAAELKASGEAVPQVQPTLLLELTPGDAAALDADAHRHTLIAGLPAGRVMRAAGWSLELLNQPSRERIKALETFVDAPYGMVVEIPEHSYRESFAIRPGQVIELGETGYVMRVEEVGAYGMPFATRGYEEATDTRARVRVTGGGEGGKDFERIVMYRYPERSQDFDPAGAGGDGEGGDGEGGEGGGRPMGGRREVDPSIRLTFLDNTRHEYHLFRAREGGGLSLLLRVPGMRPMLVPIEEKVPVPRSAEDPQKGGGPAFLHFTRLMGDAVPVMVPRATPMLDRPPKDVGKMTTALVAVRLASSGTPERGAWSRTVWVRPMLYPTQPEAGFRPEVVDVPGVGPVGVAVSRVRRELPFLLALRGFEMEPIPGSDIPRDFKADLKIWDLGEDGRLDLQPTLAQARLNNPVVHRSPHASFPMNRLKISQNGWDQPDASDPLRDQRDEQGRFTRQQRFSILGVANYPAVPVIWAGIIMVGLGTPWAFYVKPALLARRKRKLQEAVARGEVVPRRKAGVAPEVEADSEFQPVPAAL